MLERSSNSRHRSDRDRDHRSRTGSGYSGTAISPRTQSIVSASNPPKENPSNILLDYRKLQNQFMGTRYIFECGRKLDAAPLTISTATILFHRFFQVTDEKNYDIYLLGATSLYLAGKVESQQLKIRDIINVCYATIHRNSSPLDLDEKYFAFRESIIQAELLMMRTLSFHVTIQHPHKYLVHYLKTLENWIGSEQMSKSPIARTSWALLQDFHHDNSILSYAPQAVAIAVVELAMLSYGCTIPLLPTDGKSWQQTFYSDFNRTEQEEIMMKMLRLYEYEVQVLSLPDLVYQEDKP